MEAKIAANAVDSRMRFEELKVNERGMKPLYM